MLPNMGERDVREEIRGRWSATRESSQGMDLQSCILNRIILQGARRSLAGSSKRRKWYDVWQGLSSSFVSFTDAYLTFKSFEEISDSTIFLAPCRQVCLAVTLYVSIRKVFISNTCRIPTIHTKVSRDFLQSFQSNTGTTPSRAESRVDEYFVLLFASITILDFRPQPELVTVFLFFRRY
jgi:hypothetical protein